MTACHHCKEPLCPHIRQAWQQGKHRPCISVRLGLSVTAVGMSPLMTHRHHVMHCTDYSNLPSGKALYSCIWHMLTFCNVGPRCKCKHITSTASCYATSAAIQVSLTICRHHKLEQPVQQLLKKAVQQACEDESAEGSSSACRWLSSRRTAARGPLLQELERALLKAVRYTSRSMQLSGRQHIHPSGHAADASLLS